MRVVWLILGIAGLCLAGLGTALPLLPATPFALGSAYCFSRSSPAVHAWLVRNQAFGSAIQGWQEQRVIARRSKAIAVLALTASVVVSIVLEIDAALILTQALVACAVLAFLLTRTSAASDVGRGPAHVPQTERVADRKDRATYRNQDQHTLRSSRNPLKTRVE